MRRRSALLLILPFAVMFLANAQEQPFHFLMLTDPQFGMVAADREFAQETANYEFAVATVNRLKPGFVIVLGDLVNKTGDTAQIGEYLRILRKIDPAIPIYHVAGNHDVGNDPTPQSLAAYRKNIGRDYYSFRAGPVYGIVIDSTLIHSPKGAMREYEEQDIWLKKELEAAKASGFRHIIIFQHHPLFLKDPQEADQYENIPRERRRPLLEMFHSYGIRAVFAGHTHKNVLARDGQLEVIASAPVGKPLGRDGSGMRIARVAGSGMEHRYHDFGYLPESLAGIKWE